MWKKINIRKCFFLSVLDVGKSYFRKKKTYFVPYIIAQYTEIIHFFLCRLFMNKHISSYTHIPVYNREWKKSLGVQEKNVVLFLFFSGKVITYNNNWIRVHQFILYRVKQCTFFKKNLQKYKLIPDIQPNYRRRRLTTFKCEWLKEWFAPTNFFSSQTSCHSLLYGFFLNSLKIYPVNVKIDKEDHY